MVGVKGCCVPPLQPNLETGDGHPLGDRPWPTTRKGESCPWPTAWLIPRLGGCVRNGVAPWVKMSPLGPQNPECRPIMTVGQRQGKESIF